jgi:hypothetical protein
MARGDEPGAQERAAIAAARSKRPSLLCARNSAADGGRVWVLRQIFRISGT